MRLSWADAMLFFRVQNLVDAKFKDIVMGR